MNLEVFNVFGNEVATLIHELKEAGTHQVQWKTNVPRGVYFCRLHAGNYVETRKMILLN